MRKACYEAWVVYGPGTTREVAAKAGIDLLTFRPRSTELLQVGLLIIDSELSSPSPRPSPPGERGGMGRSERASHEGVYRVSRLDEWERHRAEAVSGQLSLT
jgi:hypothetical protein